MPAFEVKWCKYYLGQQLSDAEDDKASGVLFVLAESIEHIYAEIEKFAQPDPIQRDWYISGAVGHAEGLAVSKKSIKLYFGSLPVQDIKAIQELLNPWVEFMKPANAISTNVP
jgi:hypothetical protein